MSNEYTTLHYDDGRIAHVESDRLERIAKRANVTVEQADSYISGPWHEGDSHIEWVLSAPDAEIADWIIAGLQ